MSTTNELGSNLLQILQKNVNVPGVFNDLIDEIAEPALKAAIEKSGTKLDDIVYNALYPLLETELKEQVALLWAKLLGASVPDGEPVALSDVLGEPV